MSQKPTRDDVLTTVRKFLGGHAGLTDLWPYDERAEKATLCGLLHEPKIVAAMMVTKGITKDHLYLPANQIIATAILDMLSAGITVDYITVAGRLQDSRQLDGVGGPAYLTELYGYVPSANVGHYLSILIAKYARRKVMQEAAAVYAMAIERQESEAEFLETVQKLSAGWCAIGSKASDQTIRDQALKIAQKRAQDSGERIQGLSTPFPELDAYTGGTGAGHLVVISGMKKKKKGKDYGKSSGSGKTTLATDLFRHVMYFHKKPAIFLSMEMSYEEIFNRMISAWSRIPLEAMTRKKLKDEEEVIVGKWIEWIGSTKSKIADGGLELAEVIAKIRSFHALNPACPLAIIDYFQLIKSPYRKDWTMAQVSKEKSNALKGLANELGITIVVLSQLNSTGDVAEGKTLEDDADALYVIEHTDDEGSFIQLQKNRHGRDRDDEGNTPKIPVTHHDECVCFEPREIK